MKLATLNNGKRDGALVVVSRDLSRAVRVPSIALTLQSALDEWAETEPKLASIYQTLNDSTCADAVPFDESECLSPLPRAYQWADGSAYVNHVELVRKARGAEMPESFWHDPLIYQGGSDCFLAPRGPIVMGSEEWGIDFESEVAIITDDVPMGTSPQAAAAHVKLLMLVNDVSLRNLIPGELAKGFGFFQSKPSSAFSPVAITPDELGSDWQGGKVHLPLETHLNGALFGAPNAGVDMTFNFFELIAHAAKTRPLGAGCIIGSGTVSNYDRSAGSSCLAELRMLEIIESGQATTPFLRFGDTVSIAMQDRNGMSLFGTILQKVTQQDASQTK
ncbi:TPA: fumarylacetoacetate hydrolase family protein [Aeromonas salmonicida]|uniref:Fumarylacetoacetate (FAA) hydrolase n=2 Tax=Aeromonas salmonicida subsp. salmonicida TaxID=29491 RepID=A4SNS6_AERS4|nr:fumarylacetoacetate hydrolase family protein [Aeromonas salmonicida]ABO90548.1 Fumarylacetoacetate (FAA) hydrolase [Aeromonas salmonicida subsp. salmonicida A449]AYO63554.1 FAA hydrolase family protein [Aeromonas salmonicida subsp. salmonicida 01-B526]EHI54163.1 fumarylacetoacetate (FAA) hydrolase [Aeromonas salmonicida subsp. salmonicida 01-B526]EKP0240986.1 fumarylacetoacetate hydrolase family protein [Aeromonas salmonicida]EKP0245170.1 fumarylacetoacetate hydrolase family protein [Aeromo